ncbi:hypothetical protein C9J03_22250 [Photobacterium gaetbulicola]|uniref:papain-like cysteine protease family protein n=1 Tax=Photobacterium gaetbulicola TaxID=1295392 RepID=UPI0009E2A199|nr:papain-like cysteine protease family protein [Photobacterium gaetbulicola]PSU02919.1 hypothetical protein C9J03_22250 [Photobacterium gaetbulicola]
MNRFLISLLLISISISTQAQIPRPVDIPIQNIPQQTQVWCWAAVAQQIIYSIQGPQNTPPQCALVAIANGVHPGFCCNGYNPSCIRTGSIPQIQHLIAYFGGRYSSYAPPTDPMTLYRTLSNGMPVILQVRTGMISSHVVVLRGMSFTRTRYGIEPMLHINDPLAYFTQPVPYSFIAPIWMNAIVVR